MGVLLIPLSSPQRRRDREQGDIEEMKKEEEGESRDRYRYCRRKRGEEEGVSEQRKIKEKEGEERERAWIYRKKRVGERGEER